MSVCVCVAATAKDSVFHNGRTLKGEKALKGKGFNSRRFFNNFNLAHLELQWTCRKRKETAWSLAEQAVLEMFLGLYFLLKRVNERRIKVMKKMTKFTGLIIFLNAKRALLPSSLL